MPKNLVELIKASSAAGIAGQSFKTNVTGATTGVSMTSYLSGSFGSFGGSFPQPENEITYSTPQNWNIDVVLSGYGANFNQIRRNNTSGWTFLGTANATINSVTWNDGTGTATLAMTFTGNYDATTYPTLTNFTAYFLGYVSPNKPGAGAATVEVYPLASGGGAASGSDVFTLQWSYDPDIANYNPVITTPAPNLGTGAQTMRIAKAAYPSWTTTYEWEIHTSSSYNNLLGSNFYQFTSYENDANVSVGFIRYRIKAAYNGGTPGSWTNWGELLWTDPRDDI